MKNADVAIVYYNPEVIQHKGLKVFEPQKVKEAFGANVMVYTDMPALQQQLKTLDYDHSALLMMSSGDFSGVDMTELVNELLK
jgi:UDP-N-acetylmuramate: L-alanyl-gamma-D-glutamyl-meso-diaminopimelate ligase